MTLRQRLAEIERRLRTRPWTDDDAAALRYAVGELKAGRELPDAVDDRVRDQAESIMAAIAEMDETLPLRKGRARKPGRRRETAADAGDT